MKIVANNLEVNKCKEVMNQRVEFQKSQKTTYFNDMSKKIDTILRINFNPEL